MRQNVWKLPESRLPSLYKDFRNLSDLNPDGYTANIDTWKEFLIKNYCEADEKTVTFHCGEALLQELRLEVLGVPKCVDLAIDELVEENYLISMDEFNKNSRSISNKVQRKSLVNLLRWLGLNSRFISRKNEDSSSYLIEKDFVVKTSIEKSFEAVYEQIRKGIISRASGVTDLVFTVAEFYDKSGISRSLRSTLDRDTMLSFLELHKKILKRDGNIVKLVDTSTENMLRVTSNEITENDKRIVDVKTAISKIEKKIGGLEDDLDKVILKMNKREFKGLSKEVQLEYVKTKILSQKYMTRLLSYMNNLMTVKNQLDMCLTNQLVIETLNNSNEAIKSINEYIGSAEKIEDLLGEIAEGFGHNEEISQLLESYNADQELNNEIEEELTLLEGQEKKYNEDRENEALKTSSTDEQTLEKLEKLTITDVEEAVSTIKSQSGDTEEENSEGKIAAPAS
ncbi:hypothetical protein KAFR_0A00870 [Kazachstania africana CBS 2517]|uniref:Charged multivesicular body protein 7 n=1 Tax=Kazachstania africana (strain ATCC 22294 / BCRC 22015 / CBS 2517 / CECT 1963 / NBRC 1671 / NRRL Y-8276) TaxID=1071382 RepID=H2AMC5_KAZAF|nr:hypothetical protein KAFR_0A00870 [Kazachstania africana CBS 2517]CCF55525.1 hypothetical protein KAFR_0A00870 [Kazachstania africana CBS 2517]